MDALVLIDIQKGLQETGYYGEERNNPLAEENARKLLQYFRNQGWPVFHVKHDSTNPDSPLFPGKVGNQLQEGFEPVDGELLFSKHVNSAFIGTELETVLQSRNIRDIVIAGLTTEHCISTSTRMAANLGFQVSLVSDATASFSKVGVDGESYSAEVVHKISLATLQDEFARIVDTATLVK